MGMSVCLLVCLSAHGTRKPLFLYILPVAVVRSFPASVLIRYVLSDLWMASCPIARRVYF